MRLRHELCALLALVTSPCNAATRRRRQRKGAAQTAPSTGAWNASSLAEPWREPWYEHWRRGRADGRAAWGRLDAYERAWERVVSGATVARPMEAPGTNRRLFVIVAVQRTGSTWLVRELDRHPCLRVGAELFLDVKPEGKDTRAGRRHVHTWTEPAQHAGMVGLLDRRVRGADAIPFDVGGRYDRLRRRCDTLTKTTTGSISCGFKWMVSQKFESSWSGWFLRNIRGSFRRPIHISQVKGMVRDAVEVSPRRRRGGGRLREDKHAIAAVFDMSCS